MSSGFYKRRRGILEHLEAGTIGLIDLAVHDYLNLKANLVIGSDCSIPPGIVFSSSKAISALCPKGVSDRQIRRSLANLSRLGWIKRWLKAGKRGNYPILIARASVHDLSGKEYRVNAQETTDWRNPAMALVEESAANRPAIVHDLSIHRESRREKREKARKNRAAETTPPSDARYGPFWEFAKFSFEAKHNRPPTWDLFGKDGAALAAFLRRAHHVTLETWQTHATNFFESTEAFTLKQGGSLVYFISRFDTFSSGPLLAAQGKGTNGKPSVSDNIETTLATLKAAGQARTN